MSTKKKCAAGEGWDKEPVRNWSKEREACDRSSTSLIYDIPHHGENPFVREILEMAEEPLDEISEESKSTSEVLLTKEIWGEIKKENKGSPEKENELSLSTSFEIKNKESYSSSIEIKNNTSSFELNKSSSLEMKNLSSSSLETKHKSSVSSFDTKHELSPFEMKKKIPLLVINDSLQVESEKIEIVPSLVALPSSDNFSICDGPPKELARSTKILVDLSDVTNKGIKDAQIRKEINEDEFNKTPFDSSGNILKEINNETVADKNKEFPINSGVAGSPEKMNDKFLKETKNEVSKESSDKLSKDLSEELSKDIRVDILEEISNVCLKRTTKEPSKEVIDELAIEMSNELMIEISDDLFKETSGKLPKIYLNDEPFKEMNLQELNFTIAESLEESPDPENFKWEDPELDEIRRILSMKMRTVLNGSKDIAIPSKKIQILDETIDNEPSFGARDSYETKSSDKTSSSATYDPDFCKSSSFDKANLSTAYDSEFSKSSSSEKKKPSASYGSKLYNFINKTEPVSIKQLYNTSITSEVSLINQIPSQEFVEDARPDCNPNILSTNQNNKQSIDPGNCGQSIQLIAPMKHMSDKPVILAASPNLIEKITTKLSSPSISSYSNNQISDKNKTSKATENSSKQQHKYLYEGNKMKDKFLKSTSCIETNQRVTVLTAASINSKLDCKNLDEIVSRMPSTDKRKETIPRISDEKERFSVRTSSERTKNKNEKISKRKEALSCISKEKERFFSLRKSSENKVSFPHCTQEKKVKLSRNKGGIESALSKLNKRNNRVKYVVERRDAGHDTMSTLTFETRYSYPVKLSRKFGRLLATRDMVDILPPMAETDESTVSSMEYVLNNFMSGCSFFACLEGRGEAVERNVVTKANAMKDSKVKFEKRNNLTEKMVPKRIIKRSNVTEKMVTKRISEIGNNRSDSDANSSTERFKFPLRSPSLRKMERKNANVESENGVNAYNCIDKNRGHHTPFTETKSKNCTRRDSNNKLEALKDYYDHDDAVLSEKSTDARSSFALTHTTLDTLKCSAKGLSSCCDDKSHFQNQDCFDTFSQGTITVSAPSKIPCASINEATGGYPSTILKTSDRLSEQSVSSSAQGKVSFDDLVEVRTSSSARKQDIMLEIDRIKEELIPTSSNEHINKINNIDDSFNSTQGISDTSKDTQSTFVSAASKSLSSYNNNSSMSFKKSKRSQKLHLHNYLAKHSNSHLTVFGDNPTEVSFVTQKRTKPAVAKI